jgi:hypothetical protein
MAVSARVFRLLAWRKPHRWRREGDFCSRYCRFIRDCFVRLSDSHGVSLVTRCVRKHYQGLTNQAYVGAYTVLPTTTFVGQISQQSKAIESLT